MVNKIKSILAILLAISMLAACKQDVVTSSGTSSISSSSDSVSDAMSLKPQSGEESSEAVSSEDNNVSDGYSEEQMITYKRKELDKGYVYNTAKILCFGDSFTAGDGTTGGYRYYLFDRLYKAGAAFEFVGQYQHSFYNLPSKYSYHLSVGGKKTDDAIAMYDGYVKKYKVDYDIILCMFGINDCYVGRKPNEIFKYYKELLDTIYEDKDDAIVYVASLPEIDSVFAEFNKGVEDFCVEYAESTGKEVYYAEMNGRHALSRSTDCMSRTDAHPNNSGNDKMAASWYDAIVNKVLEINDKAVKGEDKTVHVNGVSLSTSEAEIAMNQQLSLNLEVLPAEADVKTVYWSSSDDKIASVDVYGIITPKAVGTATITATTLDGGKTAECKVTITEKKETEADRYTKEIFDSNFYTTENWTGDVDMIRTDVGHAFTAWVGDKKTITTAKEIDFGDDFMLTMRYSVSGGEEATNDSKYSSLTFGDFNLVVSRCAGKVTLLYKNQSIGSYQYHSIINRFEDYTVIYNKGNITVMRSGEVLFTAHTDPISIKSTLSYTWNVSWSRATCMSINVNTVE